MSLFSTNKIDRNTYVSFITEYKTTMYRIAYCYLGNEAHALDAVDEAVYLGYKHRKKLRESKCLKTWLTRILINECYRLLRQNKREEIVENLPESTYSSNELSLPVKLAVQSLPEDIRKVIVLRYFGGYTIAETANILNIPEGTVSTRSKKGLSLLRIELSE